MAKLAIEKDLIERLVPQVKKVLDDNGVDNTDRGIRANLEEWWNEKGWRVTLLRRHPNWSEEALAVVLDVTETRGVSFSSIYPSRRRLNDAFLVLRVDEDEKRNAKAAIEEICGEESTLIAEQSTCDRVLELTGVKCVVGQKASKAIGAICRKVGFENLENEADIKMYRSAYAELCDKLSPKTVTKPAILSVHPCDFLRMSHKDFGWTSCQNIAHGQWRSGALSLMNDKNTMVFYTVNSLDDTALFEQKKITRQLFSYRNGVLLQHRLYGHPLASYDDARKEYRALVQEILAHCVGVANLWTLATYTKGAVSKNTVTTATATHYPDYKKSDFECNVCYMQDVRDPTHNRVRVGGRPLCFLCGELITSHSSMYCSNLWRCERIVGEYEHAA